MDQTDATPPPAPIEPPAPPAPPPPVEPVFSVRRPIFGAIQVWVDGVQLQRKGRLGATYLWPQPDGTTKDVLLRGAFSGAIVSVDGVDHRLEPALPQWLWLLAMVPLILVVLGGAIGAAIGVVAMVLNLRMASAGRAVAFRVVTMLAISAIAFGAWIGAAAAIAGSGGPTVGDCYNGIRANSVLGGDVTAVPCSGPHDAELFGEFTYPDPGSYPSDTDFQTFAEAQCVPAFQTYVGIPLTQSIYSAIPVFPNSTQWSDGNHLVHCLIVSADGSQLTGAAKGSGQ